MLRTRVPLLGLLAFACGPSPGSDPTAGSSETSSPGTTAASTSELPTGGSTLTDASPTTSTSADPGTTDGTSAATATTTGDSTDGETATATSVTSMTGMTGTTGTTATETGTTGDDTAGDTGNTGADCAVVDSLVVDDNTDLAALDCIEEVLGDATIGPTTQLGSLAPLKNLRKVGGDLTIHLNEALVDLVGLDALEHVGKTLTVGGNHALVTMDGLGSLTRVGGLVVSNNGSLVTLSSMGGVVEFGGWQMQFYRLPKLTSLDGLAGLTLVPPPSGISIVIDQNPALTDVGGLGDCCAVDGTDLEITGNHALPSLVGLESFTRLGRLQIIANHALKDLSGLDNVSEIISLRIGYYCYDVENEPTPVGNNALVSLVGLEAVDMVTEDLAIMGNPKLPVALANAFRDGLAPKPKFGSDICKNLGGFSCEDHGPCPQ